MSDSPELSPTDWVRAQTEKILATGTTESVGIDGMKVVLFTTTGAKSGRQRYVPLMRVAENGAYAMVASKGGAPENPSWYYNVTAHPQVRVQDGETVREMTAREVHGDERAHWWELAVAAFPPYADYQANTDREIPVFVLE